MRYDRGLSSDDTVDDDTALGSDETVRHDPDKPAESGGRVQRGRGAISTIGRYTIIRELGRGGMGQVYEADDPELARRVAIKVLRDGRNDPRSFDSLRREAQALAKLVHPNIITVHDVGFEDEQLFMVMQLVDGKTIDVWAREHPDPAAIVAMFRQAGRGLAAAHAAGLVHCDFKPSNVLVDRDGVPQVGDFGLARAANPAPTKRTRAATVAGTPHYMAPEQFGGVATPASDQFSFCVSLWEALTGERPFEDVSIDDGDKAADRSLRAIPRALSPKLTRILTRGLSARPEDRYPSMEALLDALAPRRSPLIPVAIAGAVLAGGVGIAVALSSTAERVGIDVPGIPAADPRKLTDYGTFACAYAPTIDPGGDIIFDRTQGDDVDLYRLPLAGGQAQRLTTNPAWDWRAHPGSRPGEVIHLVHPTKSLTGHQIAMLDIATRVDAPIANVFAVDAVVAQGAVYYVLSTGGELRKLVGNRDSVVVPAPTNGMFGSLAASPDGTQLVIKTRLKDRSRALCFVDLALAKLSCDPVDSDESRPAFSADGRFVYYYNANEGIRRRDVATRTDSLAIPDAWARGGLAVAPDGHAVVWSNCGDTPSIIDPANPTKPVAEDAGFPSSTAQRLVWIRRTRGSSILMSRTPGRGDVELTRPEYGAVLDPQISPDGARIAFTARAPHAGIHSMPADTPGQIQNVTSDARDREPFWLDNETLVFSRDIDDHTFEVYAIAHDGGTPRLLAKDRTVRGTANGKLLVSSLTRLYWLDPKTKQEQPGPRLEESGISYLTISPNGQWLLYLVGTQAQDVRRVSLATNKTERIAMLPGGTSARSATITDEGKILIGISTWAGDLRVVEARAGTRF